MHLVQVASPKVHTASGNLREREREREKNKPKRGCSGREEMSIHRVRKHNEEKEQKKKDLVFQKEKKVPTGRDFKRNKQRRNNGEKKEDHFYFSFFPFYRRRAHERCNNDTRNGLNLDLFLLSTLLLQFFLSFLLLDFPARREVVRCAR